MTELTPHQIRLVALAELFTRKLVDVEDVPTALDDNALLTGWAIAADGSEDYLFAVMKDTDTTVWPLLKPGEYVPILVKRRYTNFALTEIARATVITLQEIADADEAFRLAGYTI